MEIEIDNRKWTFDLSVDVKKLGVGGGCTLDFTVSSGPFLSDEIEIGDGPGPELDNYRCTFDLYIDVKKLWGGGGGWWWVYLDYNVSSGPFLSYEIEIGDGPGPELDNFMIL